MRIPSAGVGLIHGGWWGWGCWGLVLLATCMGACGDDGAVAIDTETTGSTGIPTGSTGIPTGSTEMPTTGSTDDTGSSGGTVDPDSTGDTEDSGAPVEVTLDGAIQKGPLVIGSTVEVALLDEAGNPTGQVFPTVTSSDVGEFEVSFTHAGPVGLVGDGFYYNELTGAVSNAPISLRAVYTIEVAGTQPAYVNLVTHLTERRALALLDSTDLPTAIAQAEQELVTALDIGPPGIDPGDAGIHMNLLGGDTLANAYLFAMSATLVQAAAIEAGPGGGMDGSLQAFINTVANDLADDGALDPARVQLLDDAEQALYTDRAHDLLQARLSALGLAQTPPDLDLVIDTDLDDVANAMDTCPWVENPVQTPILDDVCHARATLVPDASGLGVYGLALAHLDGDGNLDAVTRSGGEWSFFAGDGAGGFTLVDQIYVADVIPRVTDMNADGIADIIVDGGMGITLVYLRTDGFDPLPTPVQSNSAYPGSLSTVEGDMNGDTYPELMRMGAIWTSGVANADMPITLLLNDGAGGFTDGTATAVIPMGTSFSGPSASALVDVTGDGHGDFVIAGDSVGGFPSEDLVAITFPGDGMGNLGPAIVSSAPQPMGVDLMSGDFEVVDVTGDGIVDIVLVARGPYVMCMPGNGDGTFGPIVITDVGVDLGYSTLLTTGDFTGDGLADLLVRQNSGPLSDLQVYVVPSLGDGSFGPLVSRVSGLLGTTNDGISWAATADLDGNGADDVLLSTGTLGTMMFTP
ncbi:FG-GAP repeat domain-containing protein [Paraliomyxa miuraensis]|uniref:FG-GAP repeat domain-containing protein n=1 Tax=Paraliomyxa miuraensis TaxID=376150 RepID=UPI00224D7121|nr:VCBS repeat-containing protein [Paraliomyxa miuraensis]MCX4240701.1 VCBS repeat-containing protein [Paraliomyxa miuraensis]